MKSSLELSPRLFAEHYMDGRAASGPAHFRGKKREELDALAGAIVARIMHETFAEGSVPPRQEVSGAAIVGQRDWVQAIFESEDSVHDIRFQKALRRAVQAKLPPGLEDSEGTALELVTEITGDSTAFSLVPEGETFRHQAKPREHQSPKRNNGRASQEIRQAFESRLAVAVSGLTEKWAECLHMLGACGDERVAGGGIQLSSGHSASVSASLTNGELLLDAHVTFELGEIHPQGRSLRLHFGEFSEIAYESLQNLPDLRLWMFEKERGVLVLGFQVPVALPSEP